MKMHLLDNIFFHTLPKFNGGMVLDDQGKYEFIHYKNEPFEVSIKINIDFIQFIKIDEEYGSTHLTCTDKNLINIFTYIENNKKIYVNYTNELTPNVVQKLLTWYKDGYTKAFNMPIESELGVVYNSLSLSEKKNLLKKFCFFCLRESLFEGFATPTCLFNTGYIQAFLFKAYKELCIICGVTNTPIYSPKTDDQTPENNVTESSEISKNQHQIVIKNAETFTSIYTIWSLLLNDFSQYFPATLTSENDLNYLLEQLFCCEQNKIKSQQTFDTSVFGSAHRNIIEFLMRVSSAANKSSKIKTLEYCKVLKLVFPKIYDQIANEETISKNWAAKNDEIMGMLYKVLGKETQSIKLIEREIRRANLNIKINL